MNVYVNADLVAAAEADTLDVILKKAGITGTNGIAVAINNRVIPGTDWERTSLNENDKIIVIKATQGG
jgi:sulfur carrier protein